MIPALRLLGVGDQLGLTNDGTPGSPVPVTIKAVPNKISISGHTDAKPYAGQGDFGNWELSVKPTQTTPATVRCDHGR